MVTTLDTSCGDGSTPTTPTVALWFNELLLPTAGPFIVVVNRDAATSTVVTTNAMAPPVKDDGSARFTVVLLSGNATT